MTLVNLYTSNEPDSTLYPEETNVLIDVVDTIITLYATGTRQGSFLLDGQKYGEEAQRILSFDLSDGPYVHASKPSGRARWTHSDTLVADAIDELLELPKGSEYRQWNHEGCAPFQRSEDVESGVYISGDHQVLVVRTEHGRFIASCCLNAKPPYDPRQANLSVLYAVAQAFQLMEPTDAELRNFQIEADDHYAAVYAPVLQTVRHYIEDRQTPSIIKWADWCAAAKAAGTLTPFFA